MVYVPGTCTTTAGADPGFPAGGGGRRQPCWAAPMWALFSENMMRKRKNWVPCVCGGGHRVMKKYIEISAHGVGNELETHWLLGIRRVYHQHEAFVRLCGRPV